MGVRVELGVEPRLIRFLAATSGVFAHNVSKGGVTDVMHGLWNISDNQYRGTVPRTFNHDTFAGHYLHDFVVANNVAHTVGPSGKTWRFLVMTQSGAFDRVLNNRVSDIGMRDNDTIPNPNAPEIMLTEAYRLHFEGRLSSLTAGGRVLQIPFVQGSPVHSGCVVSVLDGAGKGRWVRVAQAISRTVFLLESPLAAGTYDVAISTGFVGETFAGNRVDMRGSTVCGDMILAGNHFGTRITGNTFWGGGHAFQLQATPTERPNIWGWSHTPFVGISLLGNRFIDSERGAVVAVQHSPYIKSNRGRLYLTLRMKDNSFRWTPGFLKGWNHRHPAKQPPSLRLGDPGGIDAGEMVVSSDGNRPGEAR